MNKEKIKDREIEILQHKIIYRIGENTVIDAMNSEEIEYLIGQGLSEGELSQDGQKGYWKIKK